MPSGVLSSFPPVRQFECAQHFGRNILECDVASIAMTAPTKLRYRLSGFFTSSYKQVSPLSPVNRLIASNTLKPMDFFRSALIY